NLFLFQRNYMDYHADRFEDQSLLLFIGDELVGVFPAALKLNDTTEVIAHAGLTFGSFIVTDAISQEELNAVVATVFKTYKECGFDAVTLKLLPSVYQGVLAVVIKEIIKTQHKAIVETAHPTALIELNQSIKIQERRKRQQKKAIKLGVQLTVNNDFGSFWSEVLIPNLKMRFDASPVHSIAEIQYLHRCFPRHIQQLNAYLEGSIVAGVTLFNFQHICKLQYISANEKGKEVGALDLILKKLMEDTTADYSYIDMGTSADPKTHTLNQGLWEWKSGFGAKALSYETIKVQL
ncbi:MAG: hypothetical protein LAT76_12615, partial [Schleiferiaceae bacterium]|nr:hypothetical protein [Schleiferiaceae bacterium]